MKVSVKSVSAGAFQIEADITQPVRLIKEAIHQEKGERFHPDMQKLIFSGKLLKDDDTLEALNFKENDFLVVMGGKRSAPTTSSTAITQAPNVRQEEKPAALEETSSQEASQPTNVSNEPNAASEATPAPITQTESDNISTLVGMGFDRSQATQALAAAVGNIERAVEYLQTGIPEVQHSEEPSQTDMEIRGDEPQRGSSAERDETTVTSQGLSPESPLAFLHSDPTFNQLRHLVHQQPRHLPSLLRQLAESNPDLVQLINDNQEDFYHLINAAPFMSGLSSARTQQREQGIQITTEERAAIERLVALGFNPAVAAQAYFACEKDENAAANWLFEHGSE